MSSYNRVLILGRLGQTPTLKSKQGGKPFCRLSLATNNPFLTPEGEKSTSWHSVHVFGKEAENASRYLRKGGQVLVEGRIDSKSQDKEGLKSYQTFITANHLTYVSAATSAPKSESEFRPRDGDDIEAQKEFKETLMDSLDNLTH